MKPNNYIFSSTSVLESVCRETRRLFLFLFENEKDSRKNTLKTGGNLPERFSKNRGNRGNKKQHFIIILIINRLSISFLLPLPDFGGNKGQQILPFFCQRQQIKDVALFVAPLYQTTSSVFSGCCLLLPLLLHNKYKRMGARIYTRTRGTFVRGQRTSQTEKLTNTILTFNPISL